MDKTFTQNQIIQFLFGEMKEQDQMDMLDFLQSDQEAFQNYYKYRKAQEMLTSLEVSAKRSSLNKILNYSKNFKSTASL